METLKNRLNDVLAVKARRQKVLDDPAHADKLKERRLFVEFFCHPELLQQNMKELRKRARGRTVQV
jgi:hypothetical protein